MDYMMIKDLKEGMNVEIQLLVNNVNKGIDSTGSYFLNIEFKDSSGQINGKKWSIQPGDEDIFVIGAILNIYADVKKYKDNIQLNVKMGQNVDLNSVDIARFVKSAPIPKEELKKRFFAHVYSVTNKDCRSLLDYFTDKFQDKLFDYPAAQSVHHDYASGLLMHTVSMADIASFLASYYPDIDKDILLTGCLLHDFGKMIELVGPIAFHFSTEGKLLGHISIMMAELGLAKEKLHLEGETITLIEHMILSHHGAYEYGSPVLPQTKEALLLSLIDNLDSKMVIVSKALEGIKKGEFSPKVFALDNRTFYKPNN